MATKKLTKSTSAGTAGSVASRKKKVNETAQKTFTPSPAKAATVEKKPIQIAGSAGKTTTTSSPTQPKQAEVPKVHMPTKLTRPENVTRTSVSDRNQRVQELAKSTREGWRFNPIETGLIREGWNKDNPWEVAGIGTKYQSRDALGMTYGLPWYKSIGATADRDTAKILGNDTRVFMPNKDMTSEEVMYGLMSQQFGRAVEDSKSESYWTDPSTQKYMSLAFGDIDGNVDYDAARQTMQEAQERRLTDIESAKRIYRAHRGDTTVLAEAKDPEEREYLTRVIGGVRVKGSAIDMLGNENLYGNDSHAAVNSPYDYGYTAQQLSGDLKNQNSVQSIQRIARASAFMGVDLMQLDDDSIADLLEQMDRDGGKLEKQMQVLNGDTSTARGIWDAHKVYTYDDMRADIELLQDYYNGASDYNTSNDWTAMDVAMARARLSAYTDDPHALDFDDVEYSEDGGQIISQRYSSGWGKELLDKWTADEELTRDFIGNMHTEIGDDGIVNVVSGERKNLYSAEDIAEAAQSVGSGLGTPEQQAQKVYRMMRKNGIPETEIPRLEDFNGVTASWVQAIVDKVQNPGYSDFDKQLDYDTLRDEYMNVRDYWDSLENPSAQQQKLNRYNAAMEKYGSLTQQDDWDSISAYKGHEAHSTGFSFADIFNGGRDRNQYEDTYATDSEPYAGLYEMIMRGPDSISSNDRDFAWGYNGDYELSKYATDDNYKLSEDEKGIFNALYWQNPSDPQEAIQFLKDIAYGVAYRNQQQLVGQWAERATGNPLERGGAFAYARGANMMNNIAGVADVIGGLFDPEAQKYQSDVDAAFNMGMIGSTITSEQTQELARLEKNWPKNSPVGKILGAHGLLGWLTGGHGILETGYSAFSSGVDSATGGLLMGNPYSIFMGGGVYMNEKQQELAKLTEGGISDQGRKNALFQWAKESLSEYVTLELMFGKYAEGPNFWRQLAVSSGLEASEEWVGNAAEAIWDSTVNKEEGYDLQKTMLESVGYTASEADAILLKGGAQEAFFEGLSAALSVAGSIGGRGAAQYVTNRSTGGRVQKNGGQNAVLEMANSQGVLTEENFSTRDLQNINAAMNQNAAPMEIADTVQQAQETQEAPAQEQQTEVPQEIIDSVTDEQVQEQLANDEQYNAAQQLVSGVERILKHVKTAKNVKGVVDAVSRAVQDSNLPQALREAMQRAMDMTSAGSNRQVSTNALKGNVANAIEEYAGQAAEYIQNAEEKAREAAARAEYDRQSTAETETTEELTELNEQEQTDTEQQEPVQEETSEQPEEQQEQKPQEQQLSKALLGKIYRLTMATLDSNAQQVFAENFERNHLPDIISNASDIVKSAAMHMISGDTLSEAQQRLLAQNQDVYKAAAEYIQRTERAAARLNNIGAERQRFAEYDLKPKEYSKVQAERENARNQLRERIEKRQNAISADATFDSIAKNADAAIEKNGLSGAEAVHEYAQAMYSNAADAQTMEGAYHDGQNVQAYAKAWNAAMQYGRDGRNLENIKGYETLSELNEQQIGIAYTLGQETRRRNEQTTTGYVGQSENAGKVTFAQGVYAKNAEQRNVVRAMSAIARHTGIHVEFFESRADETGRLQGENGSWDKNTLTLRLDLNAGAMTASDVQEAKQAIMYTAGHELTHYIRQFVGGEMWSEFSDYVIGHATEFGGENLTEAQLNARINSLIEAEGNNVETREDALEEIVADLSAGMLENFNEEHMQQLVALNPNLGQRILQKLKEIAARLRSVLKEAFKGSDPSRNKLQTLLQEQAEFYEEASKRWGDLLVAATASLQEQRATDSRVEHGKPVAPAAEVEYSRRYNDDFMQNAIAVNEKNGFVSNAVLEAATKNRQWVNNWFSQHEDLLEMLKDELGDTFISDASYGGTEENTTVCIRSLAAQALMDQVSSDLGRPLTIAETLLVSQEIVNRTEKPECLYCYVAQDRRAYRDFLGQYLGQRDSVMDAIRNGKQTDEALYKKWLNKRADTVNARARFNLWANAVRNGDRVIESSELASLEDLFATLDAMQNDIFAQIAQERGLDPSRLSLTNRGWSGVKNEKGKTVSSGNEIADSDIKYNGEHLVYLSEYAHENPEMAAMISQYQQIKDATVYAQAASWAKKMNKYTAYNNHILKWSQEKVDAFNEHYGLRMYSFSDFSPAFILENMQMVTDASVRGLKMLAYTKEMDFAKIFAPSGTNINISVFASEIDGRVVENNIQGAAWQQAQELRGKYPNVGITMVATSDAIVDWAMQQPWVDVVIPYHLVRTGKDTAKYFNYKDYTKISPDGKIKGEKYTKADTTSIAPTVHGNDIIAYANALVDNRLTPRFSKYMTGFAEYAKAYKAGFANDAARIEAEQKLRDANPYYMKLVNETRRSYLDTQPVQPIFDMDATEQSLEQMAIDKYYQPIGGTQAVMDDIAANLAERINAGEAKQLYDERVGKKGKKGTNSLKFDFRGIENGIEVYETSAETMNMSMDERLQKFGDYFANEYIGKSIEYGKDDKRRTAWVDEENRDKVIGFRARGNNKWNKALAKVGADGDYIRVIQNASVSQLDRIPIVGTENKNDAHKHVKGFDRLNKVVKIDGNFYNVIITVRNLDGTRRVYDVELRPNKKSTSGSTLMSYAEKALASGARPIIQQKNKGVKRSERIYDPITASDRIVLTEAIQNLTDVERESSVIKSYLSGLETLANKQNKLADMENEIAALAKTKNKADTAKAKGMREAAKILREQIARQEANLVKMENSERMQNIIKAEREDAMVSNLSARQLAEINKLDDKAARMYLREHVRAEKWRSRAAEAQREGVEREKRHIARVRESEARHKYLNQLHQNVGTLYDWITAPTNKGYVPTFLAAPLADFIDAVDFTSKRQLAGKDPTQADNKMTDALDRMHQLLSEARRSALDEGAEAYKEMSGYLDLPGDYLDTFNALLNDIKKVLHNVDNTAKGMVTLEDGTTQYTPLAKMNSQQIRALNEAFKILKFSIKKMNDLHQNAAFKSARDAAMSTIAEMDKMKAKGEELPGIEWLNKAFNWKNTTPFYAFQRFGEGGKSIFGELMDGWDRMAENIKAVIEHAEKAYDSKQVRAWEREVQSFELQSGKTIRMTTAQMMSLYALNERDQGRGHLLGGGMKIAPFKHKAKTITQAADYVMTEADIDKIIGKLTGEQVDVAKKLIKFLNEDCSKWGNAVSQARFGYDMFTEKHYFPIEVSGNSLNTMDEQARKNDMFRLLNMGFTKPLVKGANNALVVRSIFDVYTQHATDMAKYNALAMPILDMIKWLNFRQKTEAVDANGNPTNGFELIGTVKSLEHAYGTNAKSYITNFIRDLNAEKDGGRDDNMVSSIISHAKAAAVGANLRVFFVQISSLPRAAYVINPMYLARALAKPKNLNPVNAVRGTEAQEKVGILLWKDLGFYSTDVGNNVAQLVKHDSNVLEKIRSAASAPAGWGDTWTTNILYDAAQYELQAKHPELQKGTAEYDKALNDRVREIVYKTQVVDSTMTRSEFMRSKGIMTLFTSFMSEPTVTVNMLNEAIQDTIRTHRSGESLRKAIMQNGGKAAKAFTVFATTALFAASIEALFSAMRDDDEYETFLQKYRDQWISNFRSDVNVFGMLPIVKDIVSVLEGNDASSMMTTGVQAIKDAIEYGQKLKEERKGYTLYGFIYKALQAASYGTSVPISNATRDGVAMYNTFVADAAGTPRVQTYSSSVQDAADAYYDAWMRGNEVLEDYILERAAVNGYSWEDIQEKIISDIKEDYMDSEESEINYEGAIRLVQVLGGKDEDEARTTVFGWKYKKDTGLNWSDRKKDYVAGNIDKETLREYLIMSGSSAEAADTYIGKCDFEKETGGEFDEMRDDYLAGKYTQAEAVKLLTQYGSMAKAKAEEKVDEWEYKKVYGASDDHYTKYWRAYAAIDKGNYSQARSYIQGYLSNGSTSRGLKDSINTRYKRMYQEETNATKKKQILEHALDLYEILGVNRTYEYKKYLQFW